MRAHLVGQGSRFIQSIAEQVGIEIVKSAADVDFCICYGGDGTLLGAERDFPGLPKIPLRKRADLDKNELVKSFRQLLERVTSGEATETRLPKLRAVFAGKCQYAVNDILIHNANITSAVRYLVEIDGVQPFSEIVGDGLVVATPFGSSAYYRSITNSVIHVGIGLAFNNSTEPVNHLVLDPRSKIRVTVTRGPALLASDNNPEHIPLVHDDVVEIEPADHEARIWEISELLCMDRPDSENGRRLRWIYPATLRQKEKGLA